MKLYYLPLGAYGTNCYIAHNEADNTCLVTDPGDEGEKLKDILESHNFKVQAILLTHGHSDHIGAVQTLVDAYHVPVYIHEGDVACLTDAEVNLSAPHGRPITALVDDVRYVKEGDTISLGDTTFTVIETPGHTPGGVCYYTEGTLLAGDTLFQGSVGRTDFPNGNFEQLSKGIKEKLYTLPDDTKVYPGHGGQTTIGEEKQYNPFVR